MVETNKACTHPNTQKVICGKGPHMLCTLCGSIIYTINNTSNTKDYLFFIKPLTMEKKTEIDPYDLFNSFLLFQHNFQSTTVTLWYLKHRKRAVIFLQKISNVYKYCERSLYLSLRYIDLLMYNTKDLPKTNFELIIISSMVLAAKFTENAIIEPNLSRFLSNQYINEADIAKAELKALEKLDYKLNRLTGYDVLMFLMNNGFVFYNEIQFKPKEYINIIYCYAKKILADFIMNQTTLQYKPTEIAWSIVHLTRKHFGLKQNALKVIRKIYDYHYSSYKECLGYAKDILGKKSPDNSIATTPLTTINSIDSNTDNTSLDEKKIITNNEEEEKIKQYNNSQELCIQVKNVVVPMNKHDKLVTSKSLLLKRTMTMKIKTKFYDETIITASRIFKSSKELFIKNVTKTLNNSM